jgi:hypothetical protein
MSTSISLLVITGEPDITPYRNSKRSLTDYILMSSRWLFIVNSTHGISFANEA